MSAFLEELLIVVAAVGVIAPIAWFFYKLDTAPGGDDNVRPP